MTDLNSPRWATSWVRAAMPTAILAALEAQDEHGYGIAQSLATMGFGRPKGGSLYPLLNRLEDEGIITATWADGPTGPGRRVYSLTVSGYQRLHAERQDWQRLTRALGIDSEDQDDASEHSDPTSGHAPVKMPKLTEETGSG